MDIEEQLKELRKEYIEKPWKREIIKRQARALQIAQGNKQKVIDEYDHS